MCQDCGQALACATVYTKCNPINIWRHVTIMHKVEHRIKRATFIAALGNTFAEHVMEGAEERLDTFLTKVQDQSTSSFAPIEGLDTHRSGLMCNLPDCYKCFLNANTLIHHRRTHTTTTANGSIRNVSVSNTNPINTISVAVAVQTWTDKITIPVDCNLLNVPPTSTPPTAITAKALMERHSQECSPEEREQDCNAEDLSAHEFFWKWNQILPTTMDEVTLQELILLTQRDNQGINQVHSQDILCVFKAWFVWASNKCFGDSTSPILRLLVMNPNPNDNESIFGRLQTAHSQTLYAGFGSLLISFVLILCGHSDLQLDEYPDSWRNWLLPVDDAVTASIQDAAADVWDIILEDRIPLTTDFTENQLSSVNTLVYHLLCRTKLCSEIWNHELVLRFLVAHHTRQDRTRANAPVITQRIAILQRCMRLAFLAYNHGNTSDESYMGVIKDRVSELLEPKFHYNIASILDLEMGFATSCAQSIPEPTVHFTDDTQTSLSVMMKHGTYHLSLETLSRSVDRAIADATNQLHKALRGYDGNRVINLSTMKDLANDTSDAFSFLTLPDNGFEARSEQFMDYLLQQQDGVFDKSCRTGEGFLVECDQFLYTLFWLLHVTSGMPHRCTTWATTRLRNAVNAQRTIRLVLQQEPALFHWYDKSRNRKHSESLTVKFILPSVADLLLQYLVFLRPVVDSLAIDIYGDGSDRVLTRYKDYLFVNAGERWPIETFRNLIQQKSEEYLEVPLNTSKFRHVVQAFMRTFLQKPEPSILETYVNRQFGHSNITAHLYGRSNTESLFTPVEELSHFRNCSQTWQRMLNQLPEIALEEASSATRLNPLTHALALASRSTQADVPILQIHHVHRYQPARLADYCPSNGCDVFESVERLNSIVPKLFKGNRSSTFVSPDQQLVFESLLEDPVNNFIVILPTGSGKSALFQYCSLLEMKKVTVVIISLKAPLEDQIGFCKDNSIPHAVYNPFHIRPDNFPRNTSQILFVQLENCGPTLMSFLLFLQAEHALGRIFVDECHLALQQQSFRPDYETLRNLPYSAQKIFMTATLSPGETSSLLEFFQCDVIAARIYRSGRMPSNIKLSVTKHVSRHEVDNALVELMDQVNSNEGERGIIYCLTKKAVDEMAQRFHNPYTYTGDHSSEERAASLSGWKSPGARSSVMVATTAFSSGVDYFKVTRIGIRDSCHSLADLVQEAGRGGRDGQSVCIVNLHYQDNVQYDALLDESICSFRANTSKCRRMWIDRCFNGFGKNCMHGTDVMCDVCDARQLVIAANALAYPRDELNAAQLVKRTAQPMNNPYLTAKKARAPQETAAMTLAAAQRKGRGPNQIAIQFRSLAVQFKHKCALCVLSRLKPDEHKRRECGHIHAKSLCFGCLRRGDTHCSKAYNKCIHKGHGYQNIPQFCLGCYMKIDAHEDNNRYGERCQYISNEFSRSFAILLFHRQPTLCHAILRQFKAEDSVMGASFDAYMKWLFTVESEHQEMNLLRVCIYFMQHFNDLQKFYV